MSYFSFGETGTEGGASKEDAAHRGTSLSLSLAKRAKRMERPGIANGRQSWAALLITSSGDPARGSTGQLCPVIKESMPVINGKGPDTIKGMSAFAL